MRIPDCSSVQSYIPVAHNLPLSPKPQRDSLFFAYPVQMIGGSQTSADLLIQAYQCWITRGSFYALYVRLYRPFTPWFFQPQRKDGPLWAHSGPNIEGERTIIARTHREMYKVILRQY